MDERGEIVNLFEGQRPYQMLVALGGVAIIRSRAGSMRSNHWHKTDSHILYVLEGRMDYWERPVGSTEEPRYYPVMAGEQIYTGPNVEHTTRFPVDTVLLSMSENSRDHASHESDVVRFEEPLG